MSGNVLLLVFLFGHSASPGPDDLRSLGNPIGLSAASDRACQACHRLPKELSHPVGVLAADRAPSDLPLGPEGRLRCQTCHEVASGHQEKGTAKLRRRPVELCQGCHSERRGDSLHSVSLGVAHLVDRVRNRSDGLDEESRLCLGCHDGAFATSATSSAETDSRTSHPIGVRYVPGRTRRWGDTALLPIGMLPPAIRLFDGQVGCGSCHSPFTRTEHLLVVDMVESRLCYSCHEL